MPQPIDGVDQVSTLQDLVAIVKREVLLHERSPRPLHPEYENVVYDQGVAVEEVVAQLSQAQKRQLILELFDHQQEFQTDQPQQRHVGPIFDDMLQQFAAVTLDHDPEVDAVITARHEAEDARWPPKSRPSKSCATVASKGWKAG